MKKKGTRLLAFLLVLAVGSACLPVSLPGQTVQAQEEIQENVTTTQGTTTAQGTTTQSSNTTTQKKEMTTQAKAAVSTERKAVWFSFDDLDFKVKTKAYFTKQIKKMFDNVKSMGMNTVVVHVRPYGDAMYESEYFPWSKIASGKQGKNPGFDPLNIMVTQAHERNLRIEAWVNPYRVTLSSTSISKLSKDNPARKWYSKAATRRNVLIYNGQIYYNPSKPAVRQLIVKGVKELVQNYDVDGIHFDDYFYPSFTQYNYKRVFDAKEYNAYVKRQQKKNESYTSITSWRRSQVNCLVRQVYQAIKKIDSSVEFGISPAGNIDNLKSKTSYYVDIDRWVCNSGYVDYICPQIYWGFQNGQYSYDKVLKRWIQLCSKRKVKLYVGLAMYRTVYYGSSEWRTSKTIMKRSVAYARKTGKTDGFYFFTYSSFVNAKAAKEKENLVAELKKKK